MILNKFAETFIKSREIDRHEVLKNDYWECDKIQLQKYLIE